MRANPWNLTPAQVRAMSAVCRTGSHKAAAKLLQITERAIEGRVAEAQIKMGFADNKIGKYIAFDRWERGA